MYRDRQQLHSSFKLNKSHISFITWTKNNKYKRRAPANQSGFDLKASSCYFPALSFIRHQHMLPRGSPSKSPDRRKALGSKWQKTPSNKVALLPADNLLEMSMGKIAQFIEKQLCLQQLVRVWLRTALLNSKRFSDSIINFLCFVTTSEQEFKREFSSTKLPKRVYRLVSSRICQRLRQLYPDQLSAVAQLDELMNQHSQALVVQNLFEDLGGSRAVRSLFDQFVSWFRNQGNFEHLLRKVSITEEKIQQQFDVLVYFFKGQRAKVSGFLAAHAGLLTESDFALMKYKLFRQLIARGVYDCVVATTLRKIEECRSTVVQADNSGHDFDLVFKKCKLVKKLVFKALAVDHASQAFLQSRFQPFFELLFRRKQMRLARQLLLEGGLLVSVMDSFINVLLGTLCEMFRDSGRVVLQVKQACSQLRVVLGLQSNPVREMFRKGVSVMELLQSSQQLFRSNATITQIIKTFPEERANFFLDEDSSGLLLFCYLLVCFFSSEYALTAGEFVFLVKRGKIGRYTPKVWAEMLLVCEENFRGLSGQLRACSEAVSGLFSQMDLLVPFQNN